MKPRSRKIEHRLIIAQDIAFHTAEATRACINREPIPRMLPGICGHSSMAAALNMIEGAKQATGSLML